MTFTQSLSQYWQLEKLQYSSQRFIVSMAVMALIWVLQAFTNLMPLFFMDSKESPPADAMAFGLAGQLSSMPFIGIALLFFMTEQIGYWQKGVYRRYLIDGFTRADILGYQLTSMTLRLIISLVMGMFISVGLGLILMPEIILQALGSIKWIFLVYLLAGFLIKGTIVLLLINTIQRFYVILAYFGWMLLENLLGTYKEALNEWMPYKIADVATSMYNSPSLLWYQTAYIVVIVLASAFGLLNLAKKHTY